MAEKKGTSDLRLSFFVPFWILRSRLLLSRSLLSALSLALPAFERKREKKESGRGERESKQEKSGLVLRKWRSFFCFL